MGLIRSLNVPMQTSESFVHILCLQDISVGFIDLVVVYNDNLRKDVHKGSPCSRMGTQRYPLCRIRTKGEPLCMQLIFYEV